MISLLFTGVFITSVRMKNCRKIACNRLPEDQRLRDQIAERGQQVGRIWEPLQ